MKKNKRKEKRWELESNDQAFSFNYNHEKKHSKRWCKRHKKWNVEHYYE